MPTDAAHGRARARASRVERVSGTAPRSYTRSRETVAWTVVGHGTTTRTRVWSGVYMYACGEPVLDLVTGKLTFGSLDFLDTLIREPAHGVEV